jgi:thiamine monophosphate kinase
VVSRRTGKKDSAKPNDVICVTGNLGLPTWDFRYSNGKAFEKDKEFKPDLSGYEYN